MNNYYECELCGQEVSEKYAGVLSHTTPDGDKHTVCEKCRGLSCQVCQEHPLLVGDLLDDVCANCNPESHEEEQQQLEEQLWKG